MKKPNKIRHFKNFKSSKKEYELSKVSQVAPNQPDSPHNTTQYIIGVNHHVTETVNLYKPHDQFAFDFQHHAMAGSMMGMMMNRFTQMQVQFTSPATTAATCEELSVDLQEEPDQGFQNELSNGSQTPKSDSKLWGEEIEEGDMNINKNDYSFYLKEAETKDDLNGLVKHLVNVLEQKDKEINDLKQKVQLNIAANITKR